MKPAHVLTPSRKWQLANPEKFAAHMAVARAIKAGLLTRQPCEACGKPYTHGHHRDYAKPLEVVWLCPSHHALEHKRLLAASAPVSA